MASTTPTHDLEVSREQFEELSALEVGKDTWVAKACAHLVQRHVHDGRGVTLELVEVLTGPHATFADNPTLRPYQVLRVPEAAA